MISLLLDISNIICFLQVFYHESAYPFTKFNFRKGIIITNIPTIYIQQWLTFDYTRVHLYFFLSISSADPLVSKASGKEDKLV